MEANKLNVNSLSKAFGDKQVLSNFSLTLEKGKIVCLMGASGSGKTTLLRILLGLEKTDSGTVDGIEKPIVCLFQEDRLLEDFSVLTNIRVAAPQASNEEILSHLTELELGEELKKSVRKLSGGMKRRVALVRAVLAPSKTLLLDEPFKGLDEEMAKKAAAYLLRHQEGRTVLVVTHEKEDAERLHAQTILLPSFLPNASEK